MLGALFLVMGIAIVTLLGKVASMERKGNGP